MDMAKTLAERIQQVMDDNHLSQVELAKVAGCTKGLINQWVKFDDPKKEMAARYAYRIADRLNYEPRWLAIGEGPERPPQVTNHRINNLIENFYRCDDRGRDTLLVVAEREASYNKEA